MAGKKPKIAVDKERCKGCGLCVPVCPQNVLEMSEEVNKKGWPYLIVKHPDKCTGCGLCVMMCPDCAIEVKK